MTNSEAVVAAPVDDKYISGVNQPRDIKGRFRQVLARLKQDLGVSGLQDVVKKVEEAENLEFSGNYTKAAAAAKDLISIIDRLDSGALNAEALENIRSTTRELGSIMANLPLPFGNENEKIRFSDLPPALRDLIDDMMTKVEKKIGKKEAAEATKEMRTYKNGSDMFSQSEVSSSMSKMLRLLT